jgi:hypothetical protein
VTFTNYVDSIRWWPFPFFPALKLPKKNFLLNGGGCGRINLYTLLVSRLVSSTLRISADPAGEGEALAVIARLHPNSPMPTEEKKKKRRKTLERID